MGEQTLSQASQASETNNAALLYLATPNEALLTIAGCSGVLGVSSNGLGNTEHPYNPAHHNHVTNVTALADTRPFCHLLPGQVPSASFLIPTFLWTRSMLLQQNQF